MPRFNDIDLGRWREAVDINTDSLWIIDKRDNSGSHSGHYHGNFIPQIVNQLIKRYTKAGEWVIDPFMGSGTTLIESQRLNRHSIGIELNKEVAEEARVRISAESRKNIYSKIYTGDSSLVNMDKLVKNHNIDEVHFAVFHPPYWDIIHFSEDDNDISNTKTLDEFMNGFGKIIDNITTKLAKDRYCAVVIGDKYMNGQVVPLGFHCMNLFLKRGFHQKAIIVKNFGETKGKQNQYGIWRYRALASDYFIFKHEYIFVFKKVF